jgi:DNA-directed RNA polymerase subunit L
VAGPRRIVEINVVEKTSDTLKVELSKGEETLLIPIVERLQLEEKVMEARYLLGHQFLDRPTLYIKTKGEKPQAVLKRVLKDLVDLYGDTLAEFDKKAEKVKA